MFLLHETLIAKIYAFAIGKLCDEGGGGVRRPQ